MDSTSEDLATVTTKMVQSGVSGSLQYLNPDYMPPSLDSKNSPLAMLARTCNSIGKDSVPSKAAHQHQPAPQQQQPVADRKDNSTRLIKSTSPGKKSSAGVDGVSSRRDPSALSRLSTAAAASVRGRSSSSPTSARARPCRDAGTRRGDGSRWTDGRPPSGAESPASTSRTADSDRESVDDLRCARHHDRPQPRRTLSPYSTGHAPPPPSLGLYESLRLQQEAAALQAAVYSPLHQLLAQRQLADPLAMYSASLQAAAVVAAAAAAHANLGHPGRLPGKDYRLGDIPAAADLMSNGDVDGTLFAAMLPLRPPVPPVAHQQPPFTCSWLTAGGEFCAQRFSTSDELFAHLRTHVDGAAATSEDPLRGALPPAAAASCSAFAPTVGGFLCGGQSATGALPVAAGSTFGGPTAASLAAAHAAASFYRSKVHRSRDTASASPTSAAGASVGAGGSLLLHAAAAAASTRYHPYKWTPTPFVAGAGSGLPSSDLTGPAPPVLSAFLQQPPYAGLFSAQTLGAAVP